MKTIDEYLQSIEDNSKTIEIMPTGFSKLDSFLSGGFMKKELVILGGFTGSGKSYVAGQIGWNVARKGFKVGYFSLEISGEMVVSRLVGSMCNIHPTLIVMNKLEPEQIEKADDAKMDVATFGELIEIHDDVYELNAIIKTIAENKYDFVIIDFIQNVISRGEEYERMSSVSLSLQKVAKIHNCCVLALSQLSNTAHKTGAVEYKGSGGIAMVADLGFFLLRDDTTGGVKLALRKNRRGFSGQDFELKFQKPGGKINEE